MGTFLSVAQGALRVIVLGAFFFSICIRRGEFANIISRVQRNRGSITMMCVYFLIVCVCVCKAVSTAFQLDHNKGGEGVNIQSTYVPEQTTL